MFGSFNLTNMLLEGESGGFSISTFLESAKNFALDIGKYVIVIVGIVLIIAGIYQIAKGLMSGGKGQVNWVTSILCLLVGGALAVGGFSWVSGIAAGGKDEITNMGTGGGYQTIDGDGTIAVVVDGAQYDIVGLD